MKNLKIKLLTAVTILFVAFPVKAQVFILDDEFEGTQRNPSVDFGLIVPYEGGDADQFVPLGEGVLVLATLGGAYLLKKRKKD